MIGYFAFFLALAAVAWPAAGQKAGAHLGMFRNKPYGPFYCKASCVASCLETKLAPNVSACVESFCSDFDENTPCDRYDASCWQSCGRKEADSWYFAPAPIQEIEVSYEEPQGGSDPRSVRIRWEPQQEANLYVLEIFPIKTAFGLNEQKVVQTMTTSTSYLFKKPDTCGVFMVRLMAVNGFGLSTPRYKRLNEWTPSGPASDLNLQVRSMERTPYEPSSVKVALEYTKPATWEDADVEIADSSLRAFDCNFPVEGDSVFGDTKPDTDGFYWPVASINKTSTGIEISLSPDIMAAQCKFLYKVLEMKTKCGTPAVFDDSDKTNELTFAINCGTVTNSRCTSHESTRTSNPLRLIVDPFPSQGDSNGRMIRPTVLDKPDTRNQESQEDPAPPSPWPAETGSSDSLWVLFENFLRGAVEGARENPEEANGRRRTTPEPDAEAPVPDVEPQDGKENRQGGQQDMDFGEPVEASPYEKGVEPRRRMMSEPDAAARLSDPETQDDKENLAHQSGMDFEAPDEKTMDSSGSDMITAPILVDQMTGAPKPEQDRQGGREDTDEAKERRRTMPEPDADTPVPGLEPQQGKDNRHKPPMDFEGSAEDPIGGKDMEPRRRTMPEPKAESPMPNLEPQDSKSNQTQQPMDSGEPADNTHGQKGVDSSGTNTFMAPFPMAPSPILVDRMKASPKPGQEQESGFEDSQSSRPVKEITFAQFAIFAGLMSLALLLLMLSFLTCIKMTRSARKEHTVRNT